MEKLIITCAPTGSVTIPTQTPYLPITPEQIADEAIRASEAGAAVVHIHARDPKDGRPSSDVGLFREIITRIRERSDVVIGLTTGGGAGMSPEERIRTIPTFKPELASFNMGPVCLSLSTVSKRFKDEDYRYSWEKGYLEMLQGSIQKNSFNELDVFISAMNDNGTKSECECYDMSHIYNVAHYVREGRIKLPVYLQFVTGAIGSIASIPEDVLHMKHTADRLFGPENYRWSLVATGANIFPMGALAMITGGNVRVGMEDNIYISRGVLAKSNAELVERVVRIAREIGREIASAEEARSILGLKGKDQVNF